MKSLEEVKKDIESKVPGTTVTIEADSLVISKAQLVEVAKFLKTSPTYFFDYLSCVTGTDYKEHLEVVYNLYSVEKKKGLSL